MENILSVFHNCVAAHKYKAAIDGYSKALMLSPENAVLFANRAFAYLKNEQYLAAVEDATNAIKFDPNYVKVVPLHFLLPLILESSGILPAWECLSYYEQDPRG